MKRLRTFLLVLLTLTVPLHAIAGKLLSCESLHAAVSALPAMKGHEMHAAVLHAHNFHPVHHASLQMEQDHRGNMMDHAADHSASAETSTEKNAGSCSVCASCSMGSVGIAMDAFQLPPATLASADIGYLAFHIPETAPDLPDDPPRA